MRAIRQHGEAAQRGGRRRAERPGASGAAGAHGDAAAGLKRVFAGGTVGERLHEEIERLVREFVDLRGETDASTVNTERLDILRMSRR
ncbi:hypothetical protein [Cryptobacterium curtum]|uniref:hypothetical protein n=1 Tax=Cryptobacterium curtum TaxID=84163 RepID=UPI00248E794D|nr:hypothetical protein [Cryptobacterium curtum]